MVTRTYGGGITEGGVAGQVLASQVTTPPTFATRPQFLTGTGAPSSGLGFNGDMYIDTAATVMYGPKASGAWPSTGTSLIGGANASAVSGVIATLPATWAASGTAVSWTVPATVNGQTVTKLVVIDVITRLLSGTPGTAATYGISISGNAPYSSRVLPTNGGGVDVGLMNLNVQNLSGTYKMANPGDTITVTSAGTFSGSTTWAIDIFGYYVGLSPGAPLQGVEFTFQGVQTINPPGASSIWCMINAGALPAFWVAPAAGYLRSISGFIGVRATGTPGGGAYLGCIKNPTYFTNTGAQVTTGTNIGQTALISAPASGALAANYSPSTTITTGNTFNQGDRLYPVLISNASMTGSYPLDVQVNLFMQTAAL